MKKEIVVPKYYKPLLDLHQTEKAIRKIKEFFQVNLSLELNLTRVTAPLFVKAGTGINDDLNGVEAPVSFNVRDLNGEKVEIVQSLAKWKRMMLADYEFPQGEGLYTDMNALRPDEPSLDNVHSIYVDQWDWERHMSPEERSLDFLKRMVQKIYDAIRRTELYIAKEYAVIQPVLPETITFIHTEDLAEQFPDLQPFERENEVARQYGAVFIIGIGGALGDGQPHDGRAPDYDDWSTPTLDAYKGLNGDIIVYNPILDQALELSSMGIRVSPEALIRQLEICDDIQRKKLYFHQRLLNGELPQSIGGGIGQSRLCMFYLRKAHIGEIQASVWPQDMVEQCRASNIMLL
ncbi:MAG: aspartate--ammonia ligase [Caldithrix sp.]|nr:aspartate--ammonia ligase [Caldithrix sp.]